MNEQMDYPEVFTTSENVENVTKALVAFNKSMGVVKKDSKNPFFKSDYADLPSILIAIKPHMEKAQLTINHFPVGDNRLVTRLSHASGQYFQSMFYMKSVKDTPQDRGSVITYMMRYNVGAILGLSIDKDDDGNKGSQSAPKKPTAKPLKILTEPVRDAMFGYINEGDLASVEKQLPKYSEGKFKTEVVKAILDTKSIAELEETQNPKK